MPAPRADDAALLDAIYGAIADPGLWPQVLTRVSDDLGAIGGMLVYNAPPGGRSRQVIGRLSAELSTLYLQRHVWNPWTHAMARVPFGKPVQANTLLDPGAIRRTALHDEILAPQGIADMMCISYESLARDGGLGGIGFALSDRRAERLGENTRRLSRLMPHLSRTFEASLHLGRVADPAHTLWRILELMPGPALLLNGGGRVVHANPAAESLLRRRDGIATSGMRLVAAPPNDSAALSRAICQALAVAEGADSRLGGPLRLGRPATRQPLLLLFVPLPPLAFALWDVLDAARVLVLAIDPGLQSRAAAEAARAAFGMTAAEMRVAAMIAGGVNAPQAAAALGISVATVKTHLARCFEKTGVNSQVGLARLLGSLAAAPLLGPGS